MVHVANIRLCTEFVYQKIIIYDISTERTYMFEIDYYTDSSGCRPVEKFIDSLGAVDRKSVV